MKIKVIAIVHFAPKANGNEPGAIDLGNGKFTQFYDSFQLWHYALGYNLMKRYPNDLEFEIWQPDNKISETHIKKSDNGVVYKLLPGNFKKTYTLSGIKKRLFSKEIIDSLEFEIKTNERVLVFFRGTNEYLLNKIVSRYNHRVPFVGMFSIQISGLLIIDHFFKNPFKMLYYYFHSLLPYKMFLTKVKNIIPSTQHDIRAIPFFEKLNVFYRENCSGWGIDIDFWSRKNKLDKESIKTKLGLNNDEKVLLISSRIVDEKQVKEIILAIGNFREENFRLIITGRLNDSPYSREVKKLIEQLMPGKVLFTGYISDEELREIYFVTDVMMSFSISEGGPFSIFQAYLMEVPVIQSSVGIASEMALQYSVSRLVNPNSLDELIKALSDFFNGNIPKTLERKIAADYFNWNTVADYYNTVFQKVSADFFKTIVAKNTDAYTFKFAMKIKVIAIVHLAPKSNINEPEAINLGNGEFTRFYDSFQFWFYALGYNLMDKYSEFIDFEIWQPDNKINQTLIKKSDNGLVYKLMPGQLINEYTLKGRKKWLYSKDLLDSLEKEINDFENVVFFFRGTKEYILNKIVNRYYKKVPFVGKFTVQVNSKLLMGKFFKHPLSVTYNFFSIYLPFKRFLFKVQNIVPSTQSDIKSNPFFNKMNVFYREDCANLGVDIEFWKRNIKGENIREKFGIKQNCKIILISSRMVKEKQVKEMILALSNFHEEDFCVIMTGRIEKTPYAIEVNELINSYLPDKVIFTGYVSDELLRDIYNDTSLFLSFSTSEGGPFSIYQAYLMEVPVIQSEVGIAGEIGRQYNISKLVDPKSFNEFNNALSDYFDGNVPKILEHQIAEDYFGWSKIVDYYFNVFRAVTKNSRNRK